MLGQGRGIVEVDRGTLRQYPGEFRRLPEGPAVRSFSRLQAPGPAQSDADAVLRELGRLVAVAVRQPTPEAYREAVQTSLPSFAQLLDAHLLLNAHRVPPDADGLMELLQVIHHWGGDHRVDEVEHALGLMRRGGELIAQFAHTAVPPEHWDEDVRLAQTWMLCRAGYVFGLVGALEIASGGDLFAHAIADSVFDDLVQYARVALRATRKAYSLRHPEPEDDDESVA